MPTLATKIRRQLDEHRERNIALWRQWARELAEDGTSPRPMDVLAVAAALGITDPGAMLEHDAGVYREYLSYKASAEFCSTDRAAKLAAFGGMDKLAAALEKAKAEVSRLSAALADIDNGSEGFWKNCMSQSERDNPRLWGEWPKPRPKWSDLEDITND